jgi:hypothetical protein
VTRLPHGSRASVIACLSAVAWASISCAPPPSEVRRLADDVAQAVGRQTPRETVAGVSRATLPGTYAEVLRHPGEPRERRDRRGVPGRRRAVVPLPGPAGRTAGVAGGGAAGREDAERRRPDGARALSAGRRHTRAAAASGARRPRQGVLDHPRARGRSHRDGHDPAASRGPAPGCARAQPGPAGPPCDPRPLPGRRSWRPGGAATVLDRRLDPGATPTDAGWVRVEADLDPARDAVGADVRLSFEVEAEDTGPVPTYPVWGDPTLTWPSTRKDVPAVRRNVVLVSIDTLRADRLGAYGAHRDTSPALDGLAAEATLFETVVAPAPWTLPSHASMMTGLYPCAHGIVGPGLGNPLPAGIVPLAERLREAGYTTGAFTEDGFVDAATFARGFGYYWENRRGDDRAPTTVAHAEAWLRDEATEPFLLFLHTRAARHRGAGRPGDHGARAVRGGVRAAEGRGGGRRHLAAITASSASGPRPRATAEGARLRRLMSRLGGHGRCSSSAIRPPRLCASARATKRKRAMG